MRNSRAVGFSLLTLVCFFSLAIFPVAANLLSNGDADSGMVAWNISGSWRLNSTAGDVSPPNAFIGRGAMPCVHLEVCEDHWTQDVDLAAYMGRAIQVSVNFWVYTTIDKAALWIESYPQGSTVARTDWLFGTGNTTLTELAFASNASVWENHNVTLCLPAGTRWLTFNIATMIDSTSTNATQFNGDAGFDSIDVSYMGSDCNPSDTYNICSSSVLSCHGGFLCDQPPGSPNASCVGIPCTQGALLWNNTLECRLGTWVLISTSAPFNPLVAIGTLQSSLSVIFAGPYKLTSDFELYARLELSADLIIGKAQLIVNGVIYIDSMTSLTIHDASNVIVRGDFVMLSSSALSLTLRAGNNSLGLNVTGAVEFGGYLSVNSTLAPTLLPAYELTYGSWNLNSKFTDVSIIDNNGRAVCYTESYGSTKFTINLDETSCHITPNVVTVSTSVKVRTMSLMPFLLTFLFFFSLTDES